MESLKIFELLHRRVLVTRGSAREIESHLGKALAEGHGEITLDFSGVDGITPSFLDETLAVIEEYARKSDECELRLMIENPPTELSSKFAAVGRGHGLSIQESNGKTWIISSNRS